MCGIAGGTGPYSDARRAVLEAQLATLTRRGPDSAGFLPGDGAVVGQTRLAVIDVLHGDPPLTDETGDVRVALNGEIYNYRALRDELVGRGHRFATGCDTEVIAHLAEDLEPRAIAERLVGMFAFAVWDARRRRLILARDRLGKKPLYWWTDGRDLVFGSEIKALLADPRVPRRLDHRAIPDYLVHGYVPGPGTFFDGIRSVPPASVLVWEEGSVSIEEYWELDTSRPPAPGTPDDHAREVRRLLEIAVRDRLVADVPLGAFLSGGVDSTAVVGIMAGLSSQPVRTFCVGFEDPRYDERDWASRVAERFGADHTSIVVRPDAATLLDDLVTVFDQPFADSSALPTYLLCKETRQHVTVALSGDGGDEVFAGYERFAVALALARTSAVPSGVASALSKAASRLGGADLRSRGARVRRLLDQVGVPMPEAYQALVRVFDLQTADELIPGTAAQAGAAHEAVWRSSAGAPLLHRVLDLNRRTYLRDDLLVKVDRMSMAHGLEVRSPLLDHRLVEYAATLPPAEHLSGRRMKRVLKAAVKDLLPADIASRPKRGFGVPLDAWFRGELAPEAASLAAPSARIARHVESTAVASLVTQHERGDAAHGQKLWSLLVLERFLERHDW
jgi:asparagine synthase (glutamine-hydrolysing)